MVEVYKHEDSRGCSERWARSGTIALCGSRVHLPGSRDDPEKQPGGELEARIRLIGSDLREGDELGLESGT